MAEICGGKKRGTFSSARHQARSAFDVRREQMKTHAHVRSRLCAMERIIASTDWPRLSALSSKSRNNRARSARRIGRVKQKVNQKNHPADDADPEGGMK